MPKCLQTNIFQQTNSQKNQIKTPKYCQKHFFYFFGPVPSKIQARPGSLHIPGRKGKKNVKKNGSEKKNVWLVRFCETKHITRHIEFFFKLFYITRRQEINIGYSYAVIIYVPKYFILFYFFLFCVDFFVRTSNKNTH